MATTLDHPLADRTPADRLEIVLAILSALPVRPSGGWSEQDLADLAGVSIWTVRRLYQRALNHAQAAAADLLAGRPASTRTTPTP